MDTEAFIKSFINNKFIKRYKLPLLKLVKPVKLRLVNNNIAETISYIVRIILSFKDYLEELYYLITLLAKFDIILRILQIELYNPYISFKDKSYIFNLNYYISECLRYYRLIIIRSPSIKALNPLSISSAKYRDIVKISIYIFIKLAERKGNQIIVLWPEDFKRLKKNLDNKRKSDFTIDMIVISSKNYKKFY